MFKTITLSLLLFVCTLLVLISENILVEGLGVLAIYMGTTYVNIWLARKD